MAALCGHFVALKHRMFLECSYITERKFMKEVSSYDTQDVEVLGVYITERKFTGQGHERP